MLKNIEHIRKTAYDKDMLTKSLVGGGVGAGLGALLLSSVGREKDKNWKNYLLWGLLGAGAGAGVGAAKHVIDRNKAQEVRATPGSPKASGSPKTPAAPTTSETLNESAESGKADHKPKSDDFVTKLFKSSVPWFYKIPHEWRNVIPSELVAAGLTPFLSRYVNVLRVLPHHNPIRLLGAPKGKFKQEADVVVAALRDRFNNATNVISNRTDDVIPELQGRLDEAKSNVERARRVLESRSGERKAAEAVRNNWEAEVANLRRAQDSAVEQRRSAIDKVLSGLNAAELTETNGLRTGNQPYDIAYNFNRASIESMALRKALGGDSGIAELKALSEGIKNGNPDMAKMDEILRNRYASVLSDARAVSDNLKGSIRSFKQSWPQEENLGNIIDYLTALNTKVNTSKQEVSSTAKHRLAKALSTLIEASKPTAYGENSRHLMPNEIVQLLGNLDDYNKLNGNLGENRSILLKTLAENGLTIDQNTPIPDIVSRLRGFTPHVEDSEELVNARNRLEGAESNLDTARESESNAKGNLRAAQDAESSAGKAFKEANRRLELLRRATSSNKAVQDLLRDLKDNGTALTILKNYIKGTAPLPDPSTIRDKKVRNLITMLNGISQGGQLKMTYRSDNPLDGFAIRNVDGGGSSSDAADGGKGKGKGKGGTGGWIPSKGVQAGRMILRPAHAIGVGMLINLLLKKLQAK